MSELLGTMTGRFLGRQVIFLGLAALALMGLLAACGGDDPTATPATPTATTPSGDGGGGADIRPGQVTEEEFFARDWEFDLPVARFYSWASVTIKRIIEDHLPNITLNINDTSANETLFDIDRRPDIRARTIIQHSPKTWDAFRTGANVLPENIPAPDVPPEPSWGIYPYSQMQVLTAAETGINDVFDLDGVTIGMGENPADINSIIYKEWFDIAGVKPREIYSTEGGAAGLLEGQWDVDTSGVVFQLTTSGEYIPFLAAKQIRFVDFNKDVILEMRENHPEWTFVTPVLLCSSAMSAAMNLDYPVISDDFVGSGSFEDENCNTAPGGHGVMYATFPEFPQEAMYQMTKVLVENMVDLQELFPGAPWAAEVYSERFAHSTELQEYFAPGAARAFDELGQTYGDEGTNAWYAARTDPLRWWLDFIE